MSTWSLIQIVFNIFMTLGLFIVVMRMSRAPKDDPRLSRGLQLLQSKISVLEDLSDRTESQVNQLVAILEQKSREVQAKVQLAEQHVHAMRVSMDRSLEVAKIFQDRIPHQEIIERQNTIKYVQAARMANQGISVDEIANQVDLPKGEIEFVASVNRDRLMFDEASLPEWAKVNTIEGDQAPMFGAGATFGQTMHQDHDQSANLKAEMKMAEQQTLVDNLSRLQFEMQNLDMQLARESSSRDLAGAFEVPRVETQSLQKLGEEFRKACEEGNQRDSQSMFAPLEQLASMIPQVMMNAPTGPQVALAVGDADAVSPIEKNRGSRPNTTANTHTNTHLNSAATSGIPNQGAVTPTTAAVPPPPEQTVLSRAAAQAKVAAALRSGEVKAQTSPGVAEDLAVARAMAKEAAAPGKIHHVINSRGTTKAPSDVKRVIFPRIQEGEY